MDDFMLYVFLEFSSLYWMEKCPHLPSPPMLAIVSPPPPQPWLFSVENKMCLLCKIQFLLVWLNLPFTLVNNHCVWWHHPQFTLLLLPLQTFSFVYFHVYFHRLFPCLFLYFHVHWHSRSSRVLKFTFIVGLFLI